MKGFFLVDFGVDECHGYVAGGCLAPTDSAYSSLVDVGFSRRSTVWRGDTTHYHAESDEHYIVVEGLLSLEVAGQAVSVPAAHLLGVRAGTAHRVLGGEGSIESFLVRVPGGKVDQVIPSPDQDGPNEDWFLLDLRAPCPDYQAGACMPETHPAYSPWWDFWSGWGRDLCTWHGQEFHYHNRAEEYYIVLKGRLDLEVDGQVILLRPGFLLGVRTGAVHGVVGGQEPIDTLFFRVPGGRGDKVVVGTRRFLAE